MCEGQETPPAEDATDKPSLASESQGHRERKVAGLVPLLTGDKKQVLLRFSQPRSPLTRPLFPPSSEHSVIHPSVQMSV